MQTKSFVKYHRIFFGLLGVSAIITEIAVLMERSVFTPANFFSYFTIESNLLAIALLLYLGIENKARSKSRLLATLRGAVTLYMVMTCIIFIVLLSGIEGATLTAVPWDNVVLHYIMPVAVLADWLLDKPTVKLTFKRALIWLVFPVFYVIYSLIRGAMVNWYPYPFLNPLPHGYSSVIITSAVLIVGVVVATWLLWLPLGKSKATKQRS